MISKFNSASRKRPLAYFDYIFIRNGIADLLDSFIATEELPLLGDIKYVSNTESFIGRYSDPKTGKSKVMTWEFKAFYMPILDHQVLVSIQLIEEQINKLSKRNLISDFLNLIFLKINHLLNEIENNPVLQKYKDSSIILLKLRQFLIDSNSALQLNELGFAQKQAPKNEIKENYSKTFEWKLASDLKPLKILFSKLKKSKFICASTKWRLFQYAFSGSFIEPQMKIKWIIKGKNGGSNQKLLFYLLNHLITANFIQAYPTDVKLQRIILLVFCDYKSKQFQNIKNTYSQYKNTSRPTKSDAHEYDTVDIIIKLLIDTIQAKKLN